MAISPCLAKDVNPSLASSVRHVRARPNTGRAAKAELPINTAPYTTILYTDPVNGRRMRSRITDEIADVAFETCRPIRSFPAYRGRRAHQGKYWFSRSQSHVSFESRFEMTALMVLDFCGEAKAVSSNPFWLLWPCGERPVRHAPDFFVRRHDGSTLVVDVKPAQRVTDQDRLQHDRTRRLCDELAWEYREFAAVDVILERNLRLLAGYHHQRFAPLPSLRRLIESRLQVAGEDGMRLGDLIDSVTALPDHSDTTVVCGIYHMMWNTQMHSDLDQLLSWNTIVRR